MVAKAKESSQVNKARKKLQQQLAKADKRINKDALKKMRSLIEEQLARHKDERIPLHKRQIVLFDENQHSAKIESKFITRLIHQLKHPKTSVKDKDLEGRVKTFHQDE
jgi:hypothetical protein